jgi:predicted nucleic acid-binding protein
MEKLVEVSEHVQDRRDAKVGKVLSLSLNANADLIVSSITDLQVHNP